VYQQQQQQQEQQQQDAENPFLDPPFSRIKNDLTSSLKLIRREKAGATDQLKSVR
jgi:hypothetical protein